MMPLNVAATSVKLAIPPPITRALLRPSGSEVAHCRNDEITYSEQNIRGAFLRLVLDGK